jgi:hypothetical protein
VTHTQASASTARHFSISTGLRAEAHLDAERLEGVEGEHVVDVHAPQDPIQQLPPAQRACVQPSAAAEAAQRS